MFILDFFTVQYSKNSTTFCKIELSHYWSYCYYSFCILLWIFLMWKPFEILMIFELFLDQILWRARNKWKFLTFYQKCAISRKVLEVSNIWMTVFRKPFYQTSCKKKKWNRINRLRVENRNVKKKEHFTSKWNNSGKTVKSYFKWS